jgi:hypothetical protein
VSAFCGRLSERVVLCCSEIQNIVQPELTANQLLKHNIDALLKARGQTRVSLAMWCRCSRSWLDKAFSDTSRGIPVKYLDRISKFFGLAIYQLFSPGIDPLTERRTIHRRKGRDRRLSAANAAEQPRSVVDVMDMLRLMSEQGRARALALCADIVNDELHDFRRQHAARDHKADTPPSIHARKNREGRDDRQGQRTAAPRP